MRIVGVIQARFSSERLPGKVLASLNGRPSLEYLCEGLSHASGLDAVVLATSTHQSDDATAEFAARMGIPCFRGPLEHVALRLLQAGDAFRANAIVRINGDSPLMDPAIVNEGVGLFRLGAAELVTNVRPRSFPKGQSVEVIAMATLRSAVARMDTSEDQEHVTRYLYQHAQDYEIRSFVAPDPRPEVQLCIDTSEHLARCARILDAIRVPPWQAGWRSCVAAYDADMASVIAEETTT